MCVVKTFKKLESCLTFTRTKSIDISFDLQIKLSKKKKNNQQIMKDERAIFIRKLPILLFFINVLSACKKFLAVSILITVT